MTLDRNQKKVFGFLVFTVTLLAVIGVKSLRERPVDMEGVLKADRQTIDAALEDPAHLELSAPEITALARLGQARDERLVAATEKWGESSYPEVSETLARGLSEHLGTGEKAAALYARLFRVAAPRSKLVILQSLETRKEGPALEMSLKLLASWKSEGQVPLELLQGIDVAISQVAGGSKDEKTLTKRFEVEFRRWLPQVESGLDLEGLRRVIARAGILKLALTPAQKLELKAKLAQASYDAKLQKETFDATAGLIKSLSGG